MNRRYRSRKALTIAVCGREFAVRLLEVPFREGVEFVCEVNGEEVRVSDRGLGVHEGFRLLKAELEKLLGEPDPSIHEKNSAS